MSLILFLTTKKCKLNNNNQDTLKTDSSKVMFCSTIDYVDIIDYLLKFDKNVSFCVNGMSMFPFIRNEDVVEVKPVVYEEIDIGTIIVFRTSWGLTVHRVIHINQCKNIYITKGDFKIHRDSPVPERNVMGIVVGIQHGRNRMPSKSKRKKMQNKTIGLLSRCISIIFDFKISIIRRFIGKIFIAVFKTNFRNYIARLKKQLSANSCD